MINDIGHRLLQEEEAAGVSFGDVVDFVGTVFDIIEMFDRRMLQGDEAPPVR